MLSLLGAVLVVGLAAAAAVVVCVQLSQEQVEVVLWKVRYQ
jgi:hypothetical protein